MYKNLFGEETDELQTPSKKGRSREETFNDYDGFVGKFKPKKTTDDCYTPPLVYEAVCGWVNDNILPLEGVEIVRPFYPGGDYEHFTYSEGCLVLDNPPFSMLAQIKRFYHQRGIRYFLFAPALTLADSARELDSTAILCGASVTYENGAVVPTSFITNLPCGDTEIWCAGSLVDRIEGANKKAQKELSKHSYPPNVTSPALLQKISRRGIDFRIPKNECVRISCLDSQRAFKKGIYGGGWLVSDIAAERIAAARIAAEREPQTWQLSPREKELIKKMNQGQ